NSSSHSGSFFLAEIMRIVSSLSPFGATSDSIGVTKPCLYGRLTMFWRTALITGCSTTAGKIAGGGDPAGSSPARVTAGKDPVQYPSNLLNYARSGGVAGDGCRSCPTAGAEFARPGPVAAPLPLGLAAGTRAVYTARAVP